MLMLFALLILTVAAQAERCCQTLTRTVENWITLDGCDSVLVRWETVRQITAHYEKGKVVQVDTVLISNTVDTTEFCE